MSPSRWAVLGLIALTVGLACTSDPVESDDVFSLDVCPTAPHNPKNKNEVLPPACASVADGTGPIYVRACLNGAIKDPADNLDLSITASAGTWKDPSADDKSGATFKASLSNAADGCVIAQLQTPNTTHSIQLDGDLLGYRQTHFVDLSSAAVTNIEVSGSPASLTTGQNGSVDISAKLDIANAGTATIGTVVTFTMQVEPADAFASVNPASVATDATGIAKTTLAVGPTATKVSVTATTPAADGKTTVASTLTVGVFPAPKTGDDDDDTAADAGH